jgi:putative transposase
MFEKDLKIHFKLGKFFLITPIDVPRVQINTNGDKDDICAIDPGVRKLATVYSPEGQVHILGDNANKISDKYTKKRDKCKFKLVKVIKTCKRKLKLGVLQKAKKRLRNTIWKAKRKYQQAELRCTNVVKDVHYKLGHFLCRKYNKIIYPDFNPATFVSKVNRVVARRTQFWSFGKLKSRLDEVIQKYSDVTCYHGSEAYTSITCGRCGRQDKKLGDAEEFNCKQCGIQVDRDVHAARDLWSIAFFGLIFLQGVNQGVVSPQTGNGRSPITSHFPNVIMTNCVQILLV